MHAAERERPLSTSAKWRVTRARHSSTLGPIRHFQRRPLHTPPRTTTAHAGRLPLPGHRLAALRRTPPRRRRPLLALPSSSRTTRSGADRLAVPHPKCRGPAPEPVPIDGRPPPAQGPGRGACRPRPGPWRSPARWAARRSPGGGPAQGRRGRSGPPAPPVAPPRWAVWCGARRWCGPDARSTAPPPFRRRPTRWSGALGASRSVRGALPPCTGPPYGPGASPCAARVAPTMSPARKPPASRPPASRPPLGRRRRTTPGPPALADLTGWLSDLGIPVLVVRGFGSQSYADIVRQCRPATRARHIWRTSVTWTPRGWKSRGIGPQRHAVMDETPGPVGPGVSRRRGSGQKLSQ